MEAEQEIDSPGGIASDVRAPPSVNKQSLCVSLSSWKELGFGSAV